jgi:hypothetical protein
MKRYLALIGLVLIISAGSATAGEIVHDFKSPAFSGIGYSSHVLTIEQLESNRRQKIKDDKKAADEKAVRDYQSTNAYKFKNNLESRIYAQLSKQIADKLFGEGASASDTDWTSTSSPFGDTISWKREGDVIYVKVTSSSGDVLAEFSTPVGSFAF